MNSDCAYVIGSSHQVCQDYARAGDGYAILSDGCSSSPDTDIGARLMVLSAEQACRDLPKSKQWEDGILASSVASKARGWADILGVAATATDATLGMIYLNVSPGGKPAICVGLCGDGGIVFGGADGSLWILSMTYVDNAPFYPAYLLDQKRLTTWRKTGKTVRRVNWSRQDTSGVLTLNYDHVTPWPLVDEGDENNTQWAGNDEFSGWVFEQDRCRFVALFSDGVGSFTERDETGQMRAVPIGEVASELVAFKSFKGAFAQRRMNAFLKQCAARGWKHHDDLSMAVIALGDE